MERVFIVILLSASFTFMILPFYITFNEFLTSIIIASGLNIVVKNYLAPAVSRMVSSALAFLGFTVYFSGDAFTVAGFGKAASLIIAWNCIGWQSLVIFSATAYLALTGNYTLHSKLLAFIVGLQGTILFNILRIVLVALIALFAGKLAAILFHDYGGSIITFSWLVIFWILADKYLLEPGEERLEGGG